MQEVLVLDPDLSKDYLDRIQNRTKEKKYCFDHAFGPECSNRVCSIRNCLSILSMSAQLAVIDVDVLASFRLCFL